MLLVLLVLLLSKVRPNSEKSGMGGRIQGDAHSSVGEDGEVEAEADAEAEVKAETAEAKERLFSPEMFVPREIKLLMLLLRLLLSLLVLLLLLLLTLLLLTNRARELRAEAGPSLRKNGANDGNGDELYGGEDCARPVDRVGTPMFRTPAAAVVVDVVAIELGSLVFASDKVVDGFGGGCVRAATVVVFRGGNAVDLR